MTFKDYRHCTPIQLRFSDVDKLNHVNNACYLIYFETARLHYFKEVFGSSNDWSKTGFVIARTEVDYLVPIYLQDEIFCFTRVSAFGTKSMTLHCALVKKTDDALTECAKSLIIVVAKDYTNQTNIPVPDLWKTLINAFEGR